MTPDQRMKLAVMVADYDPMSDAKWDLLGNIFEFVSHIEAEAHMAGQDMERENHREFYNCTFGSTED